METHEIAIACEISHGRSFGGYDSQTYWQSGVCSDGYCKCTRYCTPQGASSLALSHSSKADIVVEYCIMTGNYDIMEINQILFKLDLQPLGY